MYERHQLRILPIYQASFEEAITTLDFADSMYTPGSFAERVTNILASGSLTKPFQMIDSSRAQKQKWETLQKYVEISFQQQTYLLTS